MTDQPPDPAHSETSSRPDERSSDRKALGTLLAFSIGLVVLGRALGSIQSDDHSLIAGIISLLGLVVFAFAAYTITGRGTLPVWLTKRLAAAANAIGVRNSRLLLLLAGPVLSLGAWFAAGEAVKMRVPALAIGLWLLGIAATLVSVIDIRSIRFELAWPPWEYALITSLAVLAALIRIPDLANIPWLLTGDEGFAGLTALQFLDGSRDNIFDTAWYSWPSFYLLLPAASISAFGQTASALRLPSAIAGVLTVVALYPLARYMFDRPIAIASSIYLAVFHYHIHFSRIAINNVWDGLIFTIATYFFYRAWKENSRFLFTLSGIVAGFAFYFYASARGLALVIPIWLAVGLWKDRDGFKQRISGLVVFGVAAVTVVLPLGLYYLSNPGQFFAPLRRFSILGDWMANELARTGSTQVEILLRQFRDSAFAFTETPLRHWYQIDSPMLLPLAATFYLLGLITAVVRITRQKYVWLILWLMVAVLAGALSESTPAAQRYVFTAPAVALLIAIGLITPLRWLASIWPRWKAACIALAVVALLFVAAADLQFYFLKYTPSHSFSDGNTQVAQSVAHYLVSEDPPDPIYFAGAPRMGYRTHGTLPFLAPDFHGIDVGYPLQEWLAEEQEPTPPFTFIVLPERDDTLQWVLSNYPSGELREHHDLRGDLLFSSYPVP